MVHLARPMRQCVRLRFLMWFAPAIARQRWPRPEASPTRSCGHPPRTPVIAQTRKIADIRFFGDIVYVPAKLPKRADLAIGIGTVSAGAHCEHLQWIVVRGCGAKTFLRPTGMNGEHEDSLQRRGRDEPAAMVRGAPVLRALTCYLLALGVLFSLRSLIRAWVAASVYRRLSAAHETAYAVVFVRPS